MWVNSTRNWLWLLLFGSLWGAMEVVGGEVLYRNGVPQASVFLTAWALFVLAVSRGVLNRPGTSSAVGALAALYKLANAAPFFCHLLGIFFVGLVFDVFASLLLKQGRKAGWPRASLSGALSAYSGNALFAVLLTFVARYKYWIGDGLAKFSRHILISGSFTALAACLLVPLGLRAGESGGAFVLRRPQAALAGAAALILVAWTLGRFIG
jgi:hypothetical protein